MPRPPKVVEHPPGSIAERLNVLFKEVHPENRGPYTALEVAKLTELTGHAISGSYVSQLLRGSRTNPTMETLRALAEVFGVPVSFFVPADEAHAAEVEADRSTTRLTDKDLQDALTEAAVLSTASKRIVCALVRQLVDIEAQHRPTQT